MDERFHRLKSKIATFPLSPGVYIFRNADGEPLYVGKALVLRSRVASYFRGISKHSSKTRALIRHVQDIDIIPLENEQSALLKENELVKKWQPHYNIMLRDDKTYPWVKVTVSDMFPRIYFTRQLHKDGSLYYGPFPKVNDAKKIIEYVIKTYKIRDCAKEIDEITVTESCLSLQLKICDAPCINAITANEYRKLVNKACDFLNGQQKDILNTLEDSMHEDAEALRFELAAEKRDMIAIAKSLAKGKTLKKQDNPSLILKDLQKNLNLSNLPRHIECFDISHISGSYTVASLVVFKNGRPSKKDYRTYKIKTVVGIDDFLSMKEAVFRRYSRCLNEKFPLPDLIVIDGGKGQLNYAYQSLVDLKLNIPIISLAKRLELIFFINKKDPLLLSKYSDTLRLLQRIRDEAHRFAITFHRKIRSKTTFSSSLGEIDGVGPVLERRLLSQFKTLDRISKLTPEELLKIRGISLKIAESIYEYFH